MLGVDLTSDFMRLIGEVESSTKRTARRISAAETALKKLVSEMSKLKQVRRELVSQQRDLRKIRRDMRVIVREGPPVGIDVGLLVQRRRALDLDDDTVTLDANPLRYVHGDGRERPVTLSSACGVLLLELAEEGAPQSLEGRVLSQAIQQLRRCPLIGERGLWGRGRQVKLTFGADLSQQIKARWRTRKR